MGSSASVPSHLTKICAQGGAARNSTSSTGAAKDKGKAKEQAVVSRREDKARKRQDALFRDDEPSSGSFALAKLQQKTASKDEPPSRPTASTASRPTASSSASSVAKPKPVAGKPVAALSRSPSTSAVGGSVRDRLKAGFSDAPQKLNVIKRDNRTIEEIERDMKLRKAKEAASKNGGSALSTSISAAPAKSSKSASRSPAPARPPSNPKSARRARPATPSDEDDDDSDMSSSSTEHRKRKRSRYEKERGLNNAQRDAIWSLMGRNRSADVARERAFGSDDDSDMEATGADVLLEERRAYVIAVFRLPSSRSRIFRERSARLAAKEDAEEQERLRRHAEEKKKRKIQASK